MNDREHALRILERVNSQKLSIHEATAREPGIEQHDFVRMLVYGVIRWQARLDHAISTLASRKPNRIDPLVLQILRIGSLQIWFSGVPSYAAVSESTELASRLAPRAKSFVNAVLRRVSERSIESLDPKGSTSREVAIRTSHPEWLIARWSDTYGSDRAEAIATADQELSYPDVLVNTNQWSREAAMEELRYRGLEAFESELADHVIRLRSGTSPISDLVRDGRLYAMDEGSVAVARLIPDSARSILDLCAAPGGKSLALLLQGRKVVSSDVSLSRILPFRHSSARFFGSSSNIVVTDALQPGIRGRFDAVIIDAPCTATGTIRKNPEVRWRLSEEEIQGMASLQMQILDAALHYSDRFALYVTCSLEPEENDQVVRQVLGNRIDFVARALDDFTPLPLRRWLDSGVLRLTPESGTDGFTATLLERVV